MKSKLLLFFTVLLSTIGVSQNTTYDVIRNSPDHNILEALIMGLDLSSTLTGTAKYTVFAPTDNAFAALPPSVIFSLQNDPEGKLTNILLGHIVSGTRNAASFTNDLELVTISGDKVKVKVEGGNVFINNAKVTVADIAASNGVVHVIDAVILPAPTGKTVADIIINSPDHTTLETAMVLSAAEAQLRTSGPFTVFAPTDAAFGALPAAVVQELIADPEGKLAQTLLYHVVNDNIKSSSMTNGQKITTSNGQPVTITRLGEDVFVNGAKIGVKDLVADNGVVHSIDAVLQLSSTPTNTVMDVIISSPTHRVLQGALNTTGLSSTLRGDGPFTVFAPTDKAFELLPQGIIVEMLLADTNALKNSLLNHVISGNLTGSQLGNLTSVKSVGGATYSIKKLADNKLQIGNAIVSVADVMATNGIVHVVDAVLIPATTSNTLYDKVVNSPDHRILQVALIVTGAKATLNSDGQYTLFAPTDEAFSNLPEADVQAVFDSQGQILRSVLERHVLGAKVLSSQIVDKATAKSVGNDDLVFNKVGGVVKVNNATVIAADILASNGVLHVVDAVIQPTEVVSLTEISSGLSLVYPIPAQQLLNFDFSKWAKKSVDINIISMEGKVVLIHKGENLIGSVNVSNLTKGVYIMQANDESSKTSVTFVKE